MMRTWSSDARKSGGVTQDHEPVPLGIRASSPGRVMKAAAWISSHLQSVLRLQVPAKVADGIEHREPPDSCTRSADSAK